MRPELCRLAVVVCLAGCLGGCGYDQVVQSWVAYSPESGGPAPQQLAGHAYVLRGLTSVYSFGMDQLADKISHRGVTATVYGLTETASLAKDIIRKYKSGEDRGPIILLGHSSGADYAISIAQKLKEADVPVALAIGFDPTRIADPVPANVELFINLYQGSNLIGGGEVRPSSDFRGRLVDVDLRDHTEIVHITLDKTPVIQDAVAEKITAVAAYVARYAKSSPAKLKETGAELRPLVLKYRVPRDAPIVLWDDAIKVKAKPGETLEAIASTHGAPAWVIAQVNAIDPSRPLDAGHALIIPRTLYSDAAPLIPAPPVARHDPGPAVRVTARKPPQKDDDRTPAAVPPTARTSSAPSANSFEDRWRSEPAQ